MNIDFSPVYAPDTGAATASTDADTDTGDDAPGDADAEGADAPEPTSADAADQEWDIDKLQEKGELNDAMAEVGGNLGRSQEGDEATAADETEPDATDEGLKEGEDDEPEAADDDEETPEDETPGDGDESLDSEDEGAEDAGEEDPEETGEPLPEPIADEVQALYPERVVETTDQLTEAIEADRQSTALVSRVDQLLEEDPHLEKYMELRLQEDADPRAAAIRSMEELVTAPDPDEDPEGYADWKAERQLKEREQEQSQAEEEEVSQEVENFQQQTARSFQAYQQKHDLSDQELERFEQRVNTLVFGDQSGNVPSDQAERLARAVHADQYVHQDEVEQMLEEARREARNEAIEEMQSDQRGDGLPKPSGSSEPTGEMSPEDEELQTIGNSFEERTTTVEDWAV